MDLFGLGKLWSSVIVAGVVLAALGGLYAFIYHSGVVSERNANTGRVLEDVSHGVEVRIQAEDAAARRSACESVERLRANPRPCE